MNILILSPVIPFPLSEGGKVSQFALIDKLRKKLGIMMIFAIEKDEDQKNTEQLRLLWPDVRIKTIDLRGGSSTTNSTPSEPIWLRAARKLKNTIASAPVTGYQSGTGAAGNDFDNSFLVQIVKPKSRHFIEAFQQIIEKEKFDLVQFEFLEFADLCQLFPSDLKKILVHHELRFKRMSVKAKEGKELFFETYIAGLLKHQEKNILSQFDGIITFSEDDCRELRNLVPEKKIFVSPFAVLDKHLRSLPVQPEPVEKLVFLGGEAHFPNKEGVEWFVEHALDQVTAETGLRLTVCGNWSNETMARLQARTPNIVFAGYVDSMADCLEKSIMVSPIHTGSGIRTKILDAMAFGTPVISTSLGCEGLPVQDQQSILIANQPTQYLQAVKLLVDDVQKRKMIINAARDIIEQNFTQEAGAAKRIACYENL